VKNGDSGTGNRKPIPVIVIGGFLDTGKSRLLNSILSEHHGVRAGALVNDFGAINIDAKLVVGVDGHTVSLVNGCVCCSIRDVLAGRPILTTSSPPPAWFMDPDTGPDVVRIVGDKDGKIVVITEKSILGKDWAATRRRMPCSWA
jgi:hypothetical protein